MVPPCGLFDQISPKVLQHGVLRHGMNDKAWWFCASWNVEDGLVELTVHGGMHETLCSSGLTWSDVAREIRVIRDSRNCGYYMGKP